MGNFAENLNLGNRVRPPPRGIFFAEMGERPFSQGQDVWLCMGAQAPPFFF